MESHEQLDAELSPGTSTVPEGALLLAEKEWPAQNPQVTRYIFARGAFEDRGSSSTSPINFAFMQFAPSERGRIVPQGSQRLNLEGVTSSVSITVTNFDAPQMVTGSSSSIEVLEEAASQGDDAPFTSLFRSMNWISWPAANLEHAARLGLAAGAHEFARQIASSGSSLYPADSGLRELSSILAAPQVIHDDLPSTMSAPANLAWLAAHGDEFAGMWVALLDGELVASAKRASDLKENIGSTDGVLVAKIPE